MTFIRNDSVLQRDSVLQHVHLKRLSFNDDE